MGTLQERLDSYIPVMDPEAFFCGPTAALIHGLPLPLRMEEEVAIHVGVPNPHRAPRGAGVIGHKFVVTEPEVVAVSGWRTTSIERTWCDLAATVPLRDLVAAGDALLRRGGRMQELGVVAARHPGRRFRAVRMQALGMLDSRAESPRESHLRVELALRGMSDFQPNVEVSAGGYRYRLDLAWPARRIALEYQGAYHHDLERWRRDLVRRERLAAAGWRVVFVTVEDLRDPDDLVRRILALAETR